MHFKKTNILIGANNAGKSTALSALRLLAAMLPQARRVKPNTAGPIDGRTVRGWTVTSAALDASAFSQENVRYDFRADETRIEFTTTTGARAAVAWPPIHHEDEPPDVPRYFIFAPDGAFSSNPKTVASELIPTIGVVPTLTPLVF